MNRWWFWDKHNKMPVIYRPVAGRTFVFTLCVGIVFGFTFGYVILISSTEDLRRLVLFPASIGGNHITDRHSHFDQDIDLGNVDGSVGAHSNDEEFHKNEDLVARELAAKVRVLCWVMTSPTNHEKKARHVKATWGQRCNILLFMSSQNDTKLPSVGLHVKEGRSHLWEKTKLSFKYVYANYFDKADWFLKADDDTYVIVENLRYMLADYNTSEPVYFGCRFKTYIKQGYMSGGAGYVLSKEAVRRFVVEAIPDPTKCRQDSDGAEDVEIGKCLENIGVLAMDSRDSLGRGRFFPFVPEHHLIPGHSDPNFWYWKFIYYPSPEGMECCSDSAISFHYVPPNMMYVMDYLIYHLRPYGINHMVHYQHGEKDHRINPTTTNIQTGH